MDTIRFAGKKIMLGGKEYVLPPLGINAYRKHDAFQKLQLVQDAMGKLQEDNKIGEFPIEALDTVVELIHLALKRNYPDVDEAFLYDALDFDACNGIIPLLVSQNAKAYTEMTEHAKNAQEQ